MLILVFLLLLPLCSCSDIDKPAEDTTTATETTAAETEPVYTSPVEAEDFKGYTFTILTPALNTSTRILNEISAVEMNADIINDAIFNRNLYVSEKFNITINHIAASDYASKLLNSVRAQTEEFDAAMISVSEAFTNGVSGNVMNLNDIPQLDFNGDGWLKRSIDDMTINGKNFFAVSDLNLQAYETTPVILYCKELAAQHQLGGNFYQMVKDGTWTFDNMIVAAKQVGSDLDGNGTYDANDQYGLAINSLGALCFTYGGGTLFAPKDASGVPVYSVDERFINFFQKFIDTMYGSSALLNAETMPDRVAVMNDMFKESRVLFLNEVINRTTLFRSMEADYGILPLPKYDEEQEGYFTFVHQTQSSAITVPSTASNFDRTGRILAEMVAYSSFYVRPAYIETAIKGKLLRDADSGEMLDIIIDGIRFDPALVINIGITGDLRTLYTNASTNVVSTLTSSKVGYQKMLEKVFQNLSK